MTVRRPLLLLLGVPPPWGGGEIRALEMADYFNGRPGYMVQTYARPKGNKATQGRATVSNIWFGLRYIARGVGLLIEHRPRVIYLALPKNFGAFLRAVPLIWMGRMLGSRVCGELAGARFLFLDRPGCRRRLGLATLRCLASIRFLGRSIESAHANYGLRHSVVFSNGIECPVVPAPYSSRAHARPLELLYVGALACSKGISSIVKAVAMCRAVGCPIRLTLVGEWSEASFRDEVLDYVAQESLQEQVRFAGRVTGEEKWGYYRRAALLVHPTEWDGQPLTILEAMAMGLGVVATRVGAIPDTVRHEENGLLLPDAEPSTVADAIQQLANDPGSLEKIMRANRARYESEFTLEAYLQRVEQWLDNVQNMS